MKRMFILVGILVIILLGWFIWNRMNTSDNPSSPSTSRSSNNSGTFRQFSTNLDKSSINIHDDILSGGPGKDGIPALTEPKFDSIQNSDVRGDVLGILTDYEGDVRFYPYTILVWHEIVNDSVGSTNYAVTFCPLCGSAVVFDRSVNDQLLTFGVSGFLYQSNMLMYDDLTESFWSQSLGEGVVGDMTGVQLTILPMQRLTFDQVKAKYPQTKVLSSDTGYVRTYGINPYGNYDNNEDLYFPVKVSDQRFQAKEIMYVIRVNDQSIAFPQLDLKNGQTSSFASKSSTLTATKNDGEITVTNQNGEVIPGFYEMWFSWATQNQENGIIWPIE